jgi:hypothetical protein
MPETRRELFRTSVLSALGGLAAGAVAGYAVAETLLASQAAAPGSAGSVVAVYDISVKLWYLFHFEGDKTNCRLYSVNCVPASLSTTASVDTPTWFSVACKKLIKTPTTIMYTDSAGSSDSISLNFSGGYLDGTSLANLIKILPGSLPPQIPVSWNEIGKQH